MENNIIITAIKYVNAYEVYYAINYECSSLGIYRVINRIVYDLLTDKYVVYKQQYMPIEFDTLEEAIQYCITLFLDKEHELLLEQQHRLEYLQEHSQSAKIVYKGQ